MSDSGYFVVASKVKLAELAVGEKISQSDFASLTPDGTFVQLKYIEEEEKAEPYFIKPGKWVIRKNMMGMYVQETSFVKDKILEDFVETKHVEEKVDMFFNKLNVYKELGIEVPKRAALLYGPPGCHAKGTGILMFDGSIKKVEDVKVGDMLMGPDSKPREVLKLARGLEPMAKITPIKGIPFVVNMGHILHLTPSHKDNTTKTPINMTVRDFLKQGTTFQKSYKLTRTGVNFETKELPIPAYILGSWLGDGGSHDTSITTMDTEIKQKWQEYADFLGYDLKFVADSGKSSTYKISTGTKLGQVKKGRNSLLSTMQELELIDNKHIPHIYLTSDKKQRLELLAGMIDTDGSLSDGGYEITQKSTRLANDILYLARSLGFAAYNSKTVKTCQTGASGEYNRIFISGNVCEIPVLLERKKTGERQQVKDVLRTGFSVSEMSVGEYFGFSLDSDHLYLTEDFTIHHNTGKTSLINKLCDKYTSDNETAVIVWHTDVFEPHEVKSFIQTFDYSKHGVKKMILVVEDLGGTEVENARVRSDSSLLSLLDNKEKTFTIPIFILATTNYPEMFLGNIANRPERFDDKIKIGYPPGEARLALLKFFSKVEVSDDVATVIQSSKCKEFSPAHVREIVVRSMIYDKTQMQVLEELVTESKAYNKAFAENGGPVGFMSG